MDDDAPTTLMQYEERREDDDHEELGRPFRVVAKLRNNRLIKAREELGLTTKQAAEAIGVSYSALITYESLSVSPWSKRGGYWRSSATLIAEYYGYSPDDLWPEVIKMVGTTRIELEVGHPAGKSHLTAPDPHEMLEVRQLEERVDEVLGTLKPKQERAIRLRFGIGNDEDHTLEEVGDAMGVTHEGARRIEHTALRGLRHPERSKRLKAWVEH